MDTLGFEVQDDDEHWIVVAPLGSSVEILCKGETLEPGNTRILFYADDVDDAYQELKRKGVGFIRKLGKAEWNENVNYAIKDRDGNEF